MLVLPLGLLFAAALTGCQTTAPLPPAAQQSLTSMRTAVTSVRSETNTTFNSLQNLLNNRNNIEANARAYTSELGRLSNSVEMARSKADPAKTDEFFSSWRDDVRSINNTQLRAAGEQRFVSARGDMDQLEAKIAELRGDFKPMYSDMQDVANILQRDPTAAGLNSVEPTIRRILSQRNALNGRFDSVQQQIGRML
jgi:predicted  nucleic acid-binding Zn-ribbon protein